MYSIAMFRNSTLNSAFHVLHVLPDVCTPDLPSYNSPFEPLNLILIPTVGSHLTHAHTGHGPPAEEGGVALPAQLFPLQCHGDRAHGTEEAQRERVLVHEAAMAELHSSTREEVHQVEGDQDSHQ